MQASRVLLTTACESDLAVLLTVLGLWMIWLRHNAWGHEQGARFPVLPKADDTDLKRKRVGRDGPVAMIPLQVSICHIDIINHNLGSRDYDVT